MAAAMTLSFARKSKRYPDHEQKDIQGFGLQGKYRCDKICKIIALLLIWIFTKRECILEILDMISIKK